MRMLRKNCDEPNSNLRMFAMDSFDYCFIWVEYRLRRFKTQH